MMSISYIYAPNVPSNVLASSFCIDLHDSTQIATIYYDLLHFARDSNVQQHLHFVAQYVTLSKDAEGKEGDHVSNARKVLHAGAGGGSAASLYGYDLPTHQKGAHRGDTDRQSIADQRERATTASRRAQQSAQTRKTRRQEIKLKASHNDPPFKKLEPTLYLSIGSRWIQGPYTTAQMGNC